jgi:hypothetical protein
LGQEGREGREGSACISVSSRRGWGPAASEEKMGTLNCVKLVGALTLICAMGLPVRSQERSPAASQTEPAPRWPDGHVNLGSTPDKKGYWEVRPGLGGFPRAADVPLQPWARALYEYRTARSDLYPPLVGCKPATGPGFFNAPGFEIVDVPDLKSIFILGIAGPHTWVTRSATGKGIR